MTVSVLCDLLLTLKAVRGYSKLASEPYFHKTQTMLTFQVRIVS